MKVNIPKKEKYDVLFVAIYFMALIMLIFFSPNLTEDQRVIVSIFFIIAIIFGILVYAKMWNYTSNRKEKNGNLD